MTAVPFIDNDCVIPDGPFAAIIGANPSRGARSPILWNSVYSTLGWGCRMWPFDVNAGSLSALLTWLAENPNFIGGAIAVPHKQAIADWLGHTQLHASAQGIRAVNALARGPNGDLLGANTDGLAAARVLREIGMSEDDKVLVFGFGATAKAVVNAIRHHVSQVTVVSRSHDNAEAQALARWMSIDLLSPDRAFEASALATVVVNGTLLGSTPQHEHLSPLPSDFTKTARHLKIAFDVVYQPAVTSFLNNMPRGVVRLGGSRMNFLQAVEGFHRAHPEVSTDLIFNSMQKVIA